MKNKIIAAIIAALSIFVFLFAVSCGDNSSANNGGTDTENVTESADSAGGSEKESSGEESASTGETGS